MPCNPSRLAAEQEAAKQRNDDILISDVKEKASKNNAIFTLTLDENLLNDVRILFYVRYFSNDGSGRSTRSIAYDRFRIISLTIWLQLTSCMSRSSLSLLPKAWRASRFSEMSLVMMYLLQSSG
jgi:hypothetical protein